jgi:hypothetical protein
MSTLLLIAIVLLLVAALERNNRRQPPRPPGLHGSQDLQDRDWARTQLELLALGDQASLQGQTTAKAPRALKRDLAGIGTSRPAPR